MSEIAVLFGDWERFTGWLLEHTEKFPRRARFTLAQRIDALALAVFEGLIEARYTRDRLPLLKRINLDLEKLRLFLRLAHDQRMLDPRAFTYACEQLNAVGRQVGGWQRYQRSRGEERPARALQPTEPGAGSRLLTVDVEEGP